MFRAVALILIAVVVSAQTSSTYRTGGTRGSLPGRGLNTVYLFDECTGTTLNDRSGNGNNATLNAGNSWPSNCMGLNFNTTASSGFINLPNATFQASGAIPRTVQFVYFLQPSSTMNGYHVALGSGSNTTFAVGIQNGNSVFSGPAAGTFSNVSTSFIDPNGTLPQLGVSGTTRIITAIMSTGGGTATISGAPTHTWSMTSHGMPNGQAVFVSAGTTLPSGVAPYTNGATLSTIYWTANVATNSFELCPTPACSTTINMTDAGTGTLTIRVPDRLYIDRQQLGYPNNQGQLVSTGASARGTTPRLGSAQSGTYDWGAIPYGGIATWNVELNQRELDQSISFWKRVLASRALKGVGPSSPNTRPLITFVGNSITWGKCPNGGIGESSKCYGGNGTLDCNGASSYSSCRYKNPYSIPGIVMAGLLSDGLVSFDTGTAQSATATTIVLDATSLAVDGYYAGADIVITSGTGNGQTRRCSTYTGSTKTCTVDMNWTYGGEVTPDATSVYKLVYNLGQSGQVLAGSVESNAGVVSDTHAAAERVGPQIAVIMEGTNSYNVQQSLSATATATSPGVVTTSVPHRFTESYPVVFSAGTVPTASPSTIALNTLYYVHLTASTTPFSFQLCYDAACTGGAMNFSTTGSGLSIGFLDTPARFWDDMRISALKRRAAGFLTVCATPPPNNTAAASAPYGSVSPWNTNFNTWNGSVKTLLDADHSFCSKYINWNSDATEYPHMQDSSSNTGSYDSSCYMDGTHLRSACNTEIATGNSGSKGLKALIKTLIVGE